MAMKTLDDAAFWNGFDYGPGSFPSEFPYEIDSPVESLLSPTETTTTTTESGDDEAEEGGEEDFLVELTRRLTRSSSALEPQKSAPPSYMPEPLNPKLRAVSGSPKSTLNGWPLSRGGGISRDVSPNGGSAAPSPPMTPFGADKGHPDWDLIYAAAGQVARLRLSSEGARMQPRQQPIVAPVCTIKSHSPVTVDKSPHSGFFPGHKTLNDLSQINQYQNAMWAKSVKMSSLRQQNQHIQSRIRDIEYESINGRYGGVGRHLPQSAWPSLQNRCPPQQNKNKPNFRGLSLNGSTGVKRECNGTGVFLPRRYENPAPEPRKRSGCSTVLLPAKVVQALSLNLDDANAHSGHSQQRFTDYDLLMATRNAALYAQQRSLRPEGSIAHEVRLPQEWTY